MIERLRSLIYPTAVVVMIATLWVHAWKQSLDSQLQPDCFPATGSATIEPAFGTHTSTADEFADAY